MCRCVLCSLQASLLRGGSRPQRVVTQLGGRLLSLGIIPCGQQDHDNYCIPVLCDCIVM